MDKRIFITGPSGMGKTTLAEYIEEKHGIPFISTSARKLWSTYGFKDHEQAHQLSVLNPSKGFNYQLDVLNDRTEALIKSDTWVCDRSPIDNFVYFMVSIAPLITGAETKAFLSKVRALMSIGTHLIITPYSEDIQLTDHRIKNRYYHMMTNKLMDWALWDPIIEASRIEKRLILAKWDLRERKRLIDQWLNS